MKKTLLMMLALLSIALTGMAQTTAVINFSSTEGGTVSASTLDYQEVKSGDALAVGTEISLRVNLTNYETHYIKGWSVNGDEKFPYLEEIKYTIQSGENNLQAQVAPLPAEGFKVTFKAGPGGKITKSERMDADYNWLPFESGDILPTRKSVHIVSEADPGYAVEQWMINGRPQSSSAELWTFTSTPLDIEVTFKQIKYYEVNFSTDENGRIQATYANNYMDTQIATGDKLPEGTEVTFFVFPNEGYKVDKWIVNGVEQMPNEYLPQRLQKTLSENITVQAVLKKLPPKHQITLNHGQGGSITGTFVDPEDGYNASFDWQKDIQEGVELTVRATPNPDYMVDKWLYNNQEVQPTEEDVNLYRFIVKENAEISVTFKPGKSGYKVNYSAGEHGSIEKAEVYLPSGITSFESGQTIPAGINVIITAKPDKGYEVDQWYINDEPQQFYAGKTELETKVESIMNIRVTFKKGAAVEYPVTWSIEGGGIMFIKYKKNPEDAEFTFPKSGDRIPEGTEISVWINPGMNEVKEWFINNVLREDLAGVKETTLFIEGETNIKVICAAPAPSSYKLTYTAGTNGSLVANRENGEAIASGSDVDTDTKVQLTATPDEGFELEKWVVNGSTLSDKGLTIELTMDKDQTVEVTFIKKVVEYTLSYSIKPETQGKLMVTNTKTQEEIASGSKVAEGTEITCKVSIPDGSKWQLDKWVINGADYTEGAKKLSINLTMSKDLQIEAILSEDNAVDTPDNADYLVFIQEGQLYINGLSAPTQVSLYNTLGELILARQVETSPTAIGDLPEGIYYVLVEGHIYKVIK
ncbi:MAG: InlB B-repeat-containing protein [Porphyromonas endodontalis]|uniref:InlB B-repeat-containing protein n=1 Tax=Porphyromonas endodontalis TaxID=28124 RepID=UPI003FA0432B